MFENENLQYAASLFIEQYSKISQPCCKDGRELLLHGASEGFSSFLDALHLVFGSELRCAVIQAIYIDQMRNEDKQDYLSHDKNSKLIDEIACACLPELFSSNIPSIEPIIYLVRNTVN